MYNKIGIYGIRNKITNQIYIGQTTMNFGDRRDSHFSLLRNNKHKNIFLQNSWNQYGEDNFEFIIIHELKENDDIDKLETDYIAYYQKQNLAFNVALGGKTSCNLGKHLSTETKRKIGEKNRINMTGKKHSEETKKKMSETHKNRLQNLSKEEKLKRVEKAIEANKGNKWSNESRENFSQLQSIKPNGAKYTIDDVREIRRLHEEENKTYSEIAEITNINRHTVYLIATYKRWEKAR